MLRRILKGIAVVLSLTLLLSISLFALPTENQQELCPNGDGEYAYPGSGVTLGERVNDMTQQEKASIGLRSPNLKKNLLLATMNQLAFNATSSNKSVYTASTGSTTKGFIGPRERVKLLQQVGSRYQIQFVNYGTTDTGWVNTSSVMQPSYNFYPPVTTGNISQDYSSSGHKGIDTDNYYSTIYAIKAGTYDHYYSTKTIGGVTYTVNYGNHIKIVFTNNSGNSVKAVYGHLSSFQAGYNTSSAPNYAGQVTGATRTLLGSVSYSKGDSIGTTGNSGNCTNGEYHLHFEIQSGDESNSYDPFQYVVYPSIGY